MCWSPSTPTTCRSTARRRSTPARASASTARRSPTGSASAAFLLAARARAPVRAAQGLGQAVRRRDHGAGARSGPRPDQDRPALRLCPRRPALGRGRSAGVAYLYAPDRKAEQPIRASRRLRGRPAGRRLRRLQGAGRARRREPRLLLEPRAAAVLRPRPGRPGADRDRGARAHRRALPDRRPRSAAARPSERRAVRQQRSRRHRGARAWLRDKLALVSQKSKLAEAIRYALSRWQGLCRFLDDGRVEIDNNVVERAIRPIALGRKNALFAGSDGGGEHWATIASLVETRRLNGVDPQAYLADVIARIVAGHPQSQIDDPATLGLCAPAPLKAVA